MYTFSCFIYSFILMFIFGFITILLYDFIEDCWLLFRLLLAPVLLVSSLIWLFTSLLVAFISSLFILKIVLKIILFLYPFV